MYIALLLSNKAKCGIASLVGKTHKTWMPIGNYNMVHTLNTHTYSQLYIHVENMNKILFSSFYTSSVLTVYFI